MHVFSYNNMFFLSLTVYEKFHYIILNYQFVLTRNINGSTLDIQDKSCITTTKALSSNQGFLGGSFPQPTQFQPQAKQEFWGSFTVMFQVTD